MTNKSIIITLILLLGIACKKNKSNDCTEVVCPDILIARPYINFTLSDKITNQDLFFSIPSQYQLKDLVVFKKKINNDTMHVPVYVDSVNNPKHFSIIALEDVDTFFIQIQIQKADTIDIKIKPVITHCCLTGYIFSPLNLNNKLICTDCAFSTIVDIKK